jgi:hypothetical protein
MRWLRVAVMWLAMLAVPTAGAWAVKPAGTTLTVSVAIGRCGIQGSAAPNYTFRLRHESSQGVLKGGGLVTSDGTGFWDVSCPGPRVRAGDRLEFRNLGISTPFRVFSVPALALVTDRVRDVVTGKAPRVATVSLRLNLCDAIQFGCTATPPTIVSVNPASDAFRWASDQNMTGTTLVELGWSRGGNTVTLTQHVAVMVVHLGSSKVTGFGRRPGQSVTVTLRRGQATATTSRTTDVDAGFAGAFKRNGSAMKARIGDSVSSTLATDASMLIPQVSLQLTAAGASGTCFRRRQVTIRIRDAAGVVQRTSVQITDGARAWEVEELIMAGWTVDVWCVNARGDQVRLHALAN